MFAVNNRSSMWRISEGMARPIRRWLVLLIAAAAFVAGPPAAHAHSDRRDLDGSGNGRGHRDPAQVAGTFFVVVRGYFTSDPSNPGANTASVTQTTVSMHAQLKNDAGQSFVLDASNLRITDSYHFSGTGTIGSLRATFDGHVDPTDPTDSGNNGHGRGHDHQVVSHARLECTYTATEPSGLRHSGRIVGTRQTSP